MKTWQRVLSEGMYSQERLRNELERIHESYQGDLGHISVFCVPVRVNRKDMDVATCISNQKVKDLEICLVFEKKDTFPKANGEIITKPPGWGFVGGGADIGDFPNGESKDLRLTKAEKNAIVRKLLKGIETDDLLVVIEKALYREALEEAGLTIKPFWKFCRVDTKEDDEGSVSVVVTVLAEVLEMSDVIDVKEIKKKQFFTPVQIVEAIKAEPVVSGMPPWMYKSHARRLRTILSFLGRDLEGVTSSLQHLFGKY